MNSERRGSAPGYSKCRHSQLIWKRASVAPMNVQEEIDRDTRSGQQLEALLDGTVPAKNARNGERGITMILVAIAMLSIAARSINK
jgi:hypothetical protein